MNRGDGFGPVDVILFTLLLILVGWLLSIEFAMSADTGTIGGITKDVAEATVKKDYIVYTTVKEIEAPQVDPAEIEIMARALTAEEGYATSYEVGSREYLQILRCYQLCGAVLYNRMMDERFPDTIHDVVYQPGQYACVNNGSINRDYDPVAWEIAEGILTEGTPEDSDVIFQAEFVQGEIYEVVGNQIFCRG